MAIKTLEGIRIEPKGNRFEAQNWVNGYAFGGGIYNASVDVGLSQQPTTISLSVVLSNLGEAGETDYSDDPKTFDVSKDDLRLGTSDGIESLFNIVINGKSFDDFVLFSYDKDIQAGTKLLQIQFKDYSVMLDKIYVGLINRQGNKFVHRGIKQGDFTLKCPDCRYNGENFTETSVLTRDVSFGSYAGVNGNIVDNFANITPDLTSSTFLNSSSKGPPSQGNANLDFNLNGGYLILGTEDIPKDNCGSTPEVRYTFPDLVNSMNMRGCRLAGAFPTSFSLEFYHYKQNYVGTLREVLQNWCSDFALDFYTDGKFFIAYDIKSPIDISDILNFVDPATTQGAAFDLINTNSNAISSYKESFSLDNTYEQAVITTNTQPTTSKTESKNIQRNVGFLPLHPIDLNYSNLNVRSLRQNAYGLDFLTTSYVHNFDICDPNYTSQLHTVCGGWPRELVPDDFVDFDIPDDEAFTLQEANRYDRFDRWTNRTFGVIDTSMALSKYNQTLRNIYMGSEIVEALSAMDTDRNGEYGVSLISVNPETANAIFVTAKKNFDGAFKALGFQPLARIMDSDLKHIVISNYKGDNTRQENSLDTQYYEIYLGYYFQEEHQNVMSWERSCADSMYKYGFLTQGIRNRAPFTTEDFFENLSPDAGLVYGDQGIKRSTYSHEYEPSAKQYSNTADAPFKDLIPYTGIHPVIRYTGAYLADLDNSWGTSQEEFDKSIEFDDVKCQQYSNGSVNEKLDDLADATKQTWNMSFFEPSFHDDIDKIYNHFEFIFESLSMGGNINDQISIPFYNYDGENKHLCQKIHVCIIPLTNTFGTSYQCNPNAKISINPHCGETVINPQMYLNYQNEIKEEEKRKQKEKVSSICEESIEEELCKKALIKKRDDALAETYKCMYDENDEVSKYFCDIDPDGDFRVGFHPSYLDPEENADGNSRYIDVLIERNWGIDSIVPSDDNGDVYVTDLMDPDVLSVMDYAVVTPRIIYPVYTPYIDKGETFENEGKLYYGLMKTNIETETRAPKTVEIYGEPVNKLGNSASSIKIINNEITPDLDPLLDASTNEFLTYTTLISDGRGKAIVRVEEYHDIVSSLNDNQSNQPIESVDMTIVGEVNGIGAYLTPSKGLSKFSMSIGDDGVKTSLTFKSKPATLPKQETILNKITARLPKK